MKWGLSATATGARSPTISAQGTMTQFFSASG